MLSAHAHSNARSVDWLVRAYFAVAASRSLGLVSTYLDSADPTAKGYRVVAWVAPVNACWRSLASCSCSQRFGQDAGSAGLFS